MGRKNKETTEEERQIAVKRFRKGESFKTIAEILNRPISTVKSIIYRFSQSNSYRNKPRRGRPSVLTPADKRQIVRKVKRNPKLSAPRIRSEVENEIGKHVTAQTIRNVLHEAGLNGRTARRKPYISKVNRRKRLAYAKEHVNDGHDFWKKVVFTDESKFNLFKSDGRVTVWRKRNCELDEKNITPTVKHGGGSVLVWGCMSANGVGELCFLGGTMDHRHYINILKTNLPRSVNNMGLAGDYIFTQDNDPKHTALNTKLWLLYNTPHWMVTPPQLPDVNPIENLYTISTTKLISRKRC